MSIVRSNRIFRHFALSFCLFASSLFGANVAFDLGGVLVKTDSFAAFRETGLTTFLLHGLREAQKKGAISYWNMIKMSFAFKNALNSTAIRGRLFDFLNRVEDISKGLESLNQNIPAQEHYLTIAGLMEKYKITLPDNPPARDEHGQNLPKVMCLWMAGVPSKDIRLLIMQTAHLDGAFFRSPQERHLLASMAFMIFTPKRFAQTRKLIKEGIDFARWCKEQGHNVYILSNWDKESFEIMQHYYPKTFDTTHGLFDGIVLSSDVGSLKPHPETYNYLLNTYHLDPRDTVFIDDLRINTQAAENCDITGIFVPTRNGAPDIQTVQDTFKEWLQQRHKEYLRSREIAIVESPQPTA